MRKGSAAGVRKCTSMNPKSNPYILLAANGESVVIYFAFEYPQGPTIGNIHSMKVDERNHFVAGFHVSRKRIMSSGPNLVTD